MRYEAVHRANAGVPLSEDDLVLVDIVEDKTVYHIGCLVGDLLSQFGERSKPNGCEDYPLAKKYAKKKNGLNISATTKDVADNSYQVVVIDPDYYPEQHELILEEAHRIASELVIYGVRHDDVVTGLFPDNNSTIINNKYAAFGVLDERSDSSEE